MRYDQCVNILKRFASTVIYLRAVQSNNVLTTVMHSNNCSCSDYYSCSFRAIIISTYVSKPLNKSVFTVTFQARKCSSQFEGLIVFKNKARKAIL